MLQYLKRVRERATAVQNRLAFFENRAHVREATANRLAAAIGPRAAGR